MYYRDHVIDIILGEAQSFGACSQEHFAQQAFSLVPELSDITIALLETKLAVKALYGAGLIEPHKSGKGYWKPTHSVLALRWN